MKHMLLLLAFGPTLAIAQISGKVTDRKTKEPVYGAKLVAETGEKALSDLDGNYKLNVTKFPVSIIISAQTYLNDTVLVEQPGEINFTLGTEVQEVKSVVVSAGRRQQDIEDVSISMEIIRPELFDNKGLANLEEAVDQSPGVFTMDGQVSIRGGSGFAYGAGSRVLLLWNGMPILSGDAGDAKWNAIPLEAASQIEILKGASSVLYGSGALNGIISLSEREPGLKGETRVKVQAGIYDNPKRASLRWWDQNPMFYQGDVYYGRMFKNVGFTISGNGYFNPGYKEGEQEDRGRLSGTFYFRPEKMKRLKAGIGYNLQYQKSGNFIIWESDTFAYTPSGSADTSIEESTLTYNNGIRFSVDPYVKVYDKFNNFHAVKTRYYFIANNNISNPSQSSNSEVLYGDYQFQTKWGENIVLTSGFTAIRTSVMANLFGDHYANNLALYSQYEHKIGKFDLTGGLRLEHFEQDGMRGDSHFFLGGDSSKMIPFYPIMRLGGHYELAKATHLRASYGQGIRYPSVAERYTTTSVGALNVFANPALGPETGWAVELGIKQGVKIGEGWKGYIDIAGFINQYNNMMEFQAGLFNPETSDRLDLTNPEDYNEYIDLVFNQGYGLEDMLGFAAVNAEKARISGVEFSFNSIGAIGDVKLTSLIGYTYMNPVSLNTDSAYLSTFSTYDLQTGDYVNMLKYRFNHLVKGDVEAEWKNISLGFSARYSSNMTNIDRVFEQAIVADVYILPGLKAYRELNDKGSLVFDVRAGYNLGEHYRISMIVNNLLNNEYISRPGDVQPPRNFILQVQMKF
jgi:iron complex outermembrane receptor protein